jgi:hypothetical protein
MRWRLALAAWAAATLALGGGCSGGSDDAPTDGDGAGDSGGCDGIERGEEGGEVEIGSGYDAFEPLDDDIPIIGGPQGGFHLNLNARVEGLELGDPDDLLDPANPSTVFSIYTEGNGERLDIDTCPVRVGYRAEGDHGVLRRGVSVVFEVSGLDELVPLFDRPVLVQVEVVDVGGRHATDARTIVVRAPGTPD